MITLGEFYSVMSAIVPLYAAMILAYGSVRWWKILTPDQCSGINRFVAVFAVPLLSFQIIATNDPYTMNARFILADALQKSIVLLLLALWAKFSSRGSLDWSITLFMLATLPNTLVLGVPLLNAMYGSHPAGLVVQAVVLQCIVWYTLLLFMYEYRSARLLVMQKFPKPAASVVSVRVDSDVISLDYKEASLRTEASVGEDGKIYVQLKRSPLPSSIQGLYSTATSIRTRELPSSALDSKASTPGGSDLTNAELYSIHSNSILTPGNNSFCNRSDRSDFYLMGGSPFRVHDLDSLHSSSPWDGILSGRRSPLECRGGRTPNDMEEQLRQLVQNQSFSQTAIQITKRQQSEDVAVAAHTAVDYNAKELQMFVWSASTSPRSPVSVGEQPGRLLWRKEEKLPLSHETAVEIPPPLPTSAEKTTRVSPLPPSSKQDVPATKTPDKDPDMPSARVMTKLILNMVCKKLIRNPNTYSSVLGLTWALVSYRWNVQMPKIIEGSITILSNAGLGMAMFSLGLFMALQPKLLACGTSMTIIGMVIRFVTSPAIMSATSIAVGLRNLELRASIVQAALPQGIVPFVFSKEYNVHPDILSTAVIFGMLVSLPITLLYYVLLGL